MSDWESAAELLALMGLPGVGPTKVTGPHPSVHLIRPPLAGPGL